MSKPRITVIDKTVTLPADVLSQVQDVTRRLVAAYPPPNPGNVIVTVLPDDHFEHGPHGAYVQGQTEPFTGHIQLNARTFAETDEGEGHMPVSPRCAPWKYTLAHEYGHTFTPRALATDGDYFTDPFLGTWLRLAVGMSQYGQLNPFEGYAEAFAEWSLTGGETRDTSARRYAETYGWPAVKI